MEKSQNGIFLRFGWFSHEMAQISLRKTMGKK